MKRFNPPFCAAVAFSVVLATVAPTMAAPLVAPKTPMPSPEVVQVQSENFRSRRYERRTRAEDRYDRRDWRRDRDRFERRGNAAYWHGHRGYRYSRPGYREYNGWWFPPAAFALGAIVGGAMSQQAVRPAGNAHVEWCYDRYRSYRASDNTYQPYNGPRRQCNSPYS
jgi:hypothetical protein